MSRHTRKSGLTLIILYSVLPSPNSIPWKESNMVTYAFILVVLCAVAMGIALFVNVIYPMVSYPQKTPLQVIAVTAGLTLYYIIAAVYFHTYHSVTILVICASLKCLGVIIDIIIKSSIWCLLDVVLMVQLIVVAAVLAA